MYALRSSIVRSKDKARHLTIESRKEKDCLRRSFLAPFYIILRSVYSRKSLQIEHGIRGKDVFAGSVKRAYSTGPRNWNIWSLVSRYAVPV
jgi:hypothetical protein